MCDHRARLGMNSRDDLEHFTLSMPLWMKIILTVATLVSLATAAVIVWTIIMLVMWIIR